MEEYAVAESGDVLLLFHGVGKASDGATSDADSREKGDDGGLAAEGLGI